MSNEKDYKFGEVVNTVLNSTEDGYVISEQLMGRLRFSKSKHPTRMELNGITTVIGAVLQGLPNPEKPGVSITDFGAVIDYTGDGIVHTTNGRLIPKPDDRVFVEKTKCLRGFTPEALAKLEFHVIEITTVASGKKAYALIKRGPLKALLAKHQAFLEAVI